MRIAHSIMAIALGTIVLMIYGCSGTTPPTSYYTLSPTDKRLAFSAGDSTFKNISIGIGPITFPIEMDRSSITTQPSSNRIEVSEFHRWGGPIKEQFTNILVENLSLLLNNDQIMARPWGSHFKPDIRVVIQVVRFGGILGKHASLTATWMVYKVADESTSTIHRETFKEDTAADGYEALVAAQSKTVAKLSEVIAEAIFEKQRNQEQID